LPAVPAVARQVCAAEHVVFWVEQSEQVSPPVPQAVAAVPARQMPSLEQQPSQVLALQLLPAFNDVSQAQSARTTDETSHILEAKFSMLTTRSLIRNNRGVGQIASLRRPLQDSIAGWS